MKDSPLFTVIFPIVWIAAALGAIIAIPVVVHHAYGVSYVGGGLVYFWMYPAIAIGYAIWKKRRNKTEQKKLS